MSVKHKNGRPLTRRFYETLAAPVAPTFQSPAWTFTGTTLTALQRWQSQTITSFRQALGPGSAPVKLQPENLAIRHGDGWTAKKVAYSVAPGLATVAWLYRPTHYKPPFPAVLCCHGSGPGKDPLTGWWNGADCREYHKMIVPRLAQAGFLVLVPDRRGHGDCSPWTDGYPKATDLIRLDAFYRQQGRSLVANDIFDAGRAIDFLVSLPGTDRRRIGCVGIEAGATVAAGIAVLDARIKALVLACFATDQGRLPGITDIPGVTGFMTPLEFCALAAPRPLLLQIPEADPVCPLAGARRMAAKLQPIYHLADAADCFVAHEFDGVLELDYPAAEAWFRRWLRQGEKNQ